MPDPAAAVRIALTTISSVEEGRSLAHILVERRLAACVNLIPNLTSIYRWQGKVEESSEFLLLIKTTAERLPALEAAIGELHPYDTPEWLVFTPEAGSQAYLAWLLDSVNGPANP